MTCADGHDYRCPSCDSVDTCPCGPRPMLVRCADCGATALDVTPASAFHRVTLTSTEGDVVADVKIAPAARRLDPAEIDPADILVKVVHHPKSWTQLMAWTAVRFAVIDGRIRL